MARSRSPGGSARWCCAAVEAALDRRRRQMSELKVRVNSAANRAASLRDQTDAADTERRRLEQQLDNVKEEREQLSVIHFTV